MLKIYAKPGVAVSLGFEGEQEARQILFDISQWGQLYGEGKAMLIAQRCGEEVPYPVEIRQDEKYLIWTVSAADTALPGMGKCELRYYTGNTLAKSEIWTTVVCAAMGQEGEPPEAQQGWVDAVLRAAESVEKTLTTAENAVTTAQQAVDTAEKAAATVEEAAETVNQTAVTVDQVTARAEQAAVTAAQMAAEAEQSANKAQATAETTEESAGAAEQAAAAAARHAETARQAETGVQQAAADAGEQADAAAKAAATAQENAAAAKNAVAAAQKAETAAGQAAAAAEQEAAAAAQAASTAEQAAETARQAAKQGPVIGESGTWLVWDAEAGAYVDSGVHAAGENVAELPEITEDDVGKMLIAGADGTVSWGAATAGFQAEIHVTAVSGTTVTCEMGDTVLTAKEQGGLWVFHVEAYGNWTIKGTRDLYTSQTVVEVTVSKIYTAELIEGELTGVYGVTWDRSASTKLSRTDCAALFTDPIPGYESTVGSSPFDNLMPWSGMEPVTIDGNAMVRIPKFWFRWTDRAESLSLQISDHEIEGFHVSPLHADRGDGKGERDTAYIGRYKIVNNRYQTLAGYKPTIVTVDGDPRSAFRDGIHTYQSEGFHMQDWGAFWTTRMLYLVEFADWYSKNVIGPGCPTGSSYPCVNGLTADMAYHTGRVSEGSVSYRYIENLWTNGTEFVDGIRKESRTIYINNNPEYGRAYPDDPGTVKLGFQTVNGGYITSFYVPTEEGCEYALFPDAVLGTSYTSTDEYITDYFAWNDAATEVVVGGNSASYTTFGMFYIAATMCETTELGDVNDGTMTTRVMYLP